MKNDSVTFNSVQLSCIPGSLAECLDIIPPDNARLQIPELVELTKEKKAEKALLYTPSPFTVDELKALPDESREILLKVPVSINLATCFPANQQSNLFTMYTGIWVDDRKELNGEKKRVATTDTFFDCLLRANKKIAVITYKDSAIKKLFSGKNTLIICEKTPEKLLERALSLIEENVFDVLVVYEKNVVSNEPAHRALTMFSSLYGAVEHCWSKTTNLIGFAPDRAEGRNHFNRHNNRPTPLSLNVTQYYGIIDNSEPELPSEITEEEDPQ